MKKITANNESHLLEYIIQKGFYQICTINDAQKMLQKNEVINSKRTIERMVANTTWLESLEEVDYKNSNKNKFLNTLVFKNILLQERKKRNLTLFIRLHPINKDINKNKVNLFVLSASDGKGSKRWCLIESDKDESIIKGLKCLADKRNSTFFPSGILIKQSKNIDQDKLSGIKIITEHYYEEVSNIGENNIVNKQNINTKLSNLDKLESESIHIIREAMVNADNPVMLYSIGKDSAVMLHLAQKAFYPSPLPFPLLHVDTRWKFKAMYDFRDKIAQKYNLDLIVHTNPDGIKKNINPFDHGSSIHTDIMKTQGLKQALDTYNFDVAFGGARRDEEKSRAKERIFSFRNSNHGWDPKNQRPELWNLYNCRTNLGETIRVFPLSNWTELDIWQYIHQEQIPIVPLYFAAKRPVINRNNTLIMVDDDRLNLMPNEEIEIRKVRFRTLGCYPLTGAFESSASNIAEIILELLQSHSSERQGRTIDNDSNASMEKKKKEGYF